MPADEAGEAVKLTGEGAAIGLGADTGAAEGWGIAPGVGAEDGDQLDGCGG
ncbi:MAG: hypothetical protein PHP35_00860 [Candidatus Colwellbacteria bacterium]|nr:hypothetical protein [Candidatus Colwellbacteria bacterium]